MERWQGGALEGIQVARLLSLTNGANSSSGCIAMTGASVNLVLAWILIPRVRVSEGYLLMVQCGVRSRCAMLECLRGL